MANTPLESVSAGIAGGRFRPKQVSFTGIRRIIIKAASQSSSISMEDKKNNKLFKELGFFSLKREIKDAVSRAEMIAPTALDIEEEKRIKQEQMLLGYNLWDDLVRSNESLTALADAVKVTNDLKDLRFKAEEAKLIAELAEMDAINYQLLNQAYKASLDVCKFLDHYEMSKLLNGPFNKEGACLIIRAGLDGVTSEAWAEKLLNMYTKWSKKHACEGRVVEKRLSKGEGIRSATIEFETEYVYGYLSGEKGTHRMLCNSLDGSTVLETCSTDVDVIPLFLQSAPNLHIDDKDMEISSQESQFYDGSSYRRETVVSIQHIPSGNSVQCSGERSHFANKMKALNRLKAKLLVLAMEQGVSEVDKITRECIVTEWNCEARRYVFHPHKLVEDVRTGVQLRDLNSVLDGNIEPLIRAHISHRQGSEMG